MRWLRRPRKPQPFGLGPAGGSGIAIGIGTAIAIGVAAAVTVGGGGGDPGLANIWVDTDGGTCTYSASQVEYSDAAACSTLDSAWDGVAAGDTVRVKAGQYTASQTVTGDKASDTFIYAADGETPQFTSATINLQANHIYIGDTDEDERDGMWMGSVNPSGTNITMLNVDVTCDNTSPWTMYSGNCNARFGATDGGGPCPSSFLMQGGSIGPTIDIEGGSASPGNSKLCWWPTNSGPITFDGVHIHDNVTIGAPHTECLFLSGGQNVTIKNSYFSGCIGYSIYFTHCHDSGCDPTSFPRLKDFVFENNVVEAADFNVEMRVGAFVEVVENWTFRNNTIDGVLSTAGPPDDTMSYTNFVSTGNIFRFHDNCTFSGMSWTYNVIPADTTGFCGSGTNYGFGGSMSTMGFVAYTGEGDINDYHLNAGSAAIDRGNASNYPSTDRDGNPRYVGSAPDAGAYERQSVP